jgi:O-antigen/teichoic acid export membrane protein
MGVIQRQGIKQSLVTYLGVLLGGINVLFIYTTTLSPDQYGFIQVLVSGTKLFLPFVLLGAQSLIVRFFPRFEDQEQGHHGYLFFLLLLPTLGILLISLINWVADPNLLSLFFETTPMIELYGGYLIPWLGLLAYSQVFTRYEMNFHRIAVPAIFNDLFVKIGIPLCCVLYYFGWLTFEQALVGIVLLHGVILLAHLIYTSWLGQLFLRPQGQKLRKPLLKEMGEYASFGILGNLGSAVVPYIDTFMVGALISLSSAAVYTIPNFVTNAIDIPRRALAQISAPIVTRAWEENDREELLSLYQKSSINQFIIGLFILMGIWVSIDELYALIPEGGNKEIYQTGKYVVLILGISKVVDMVTGINTELIMYSRHFKVNFYSIITLAGVSIFLNFLLIPRMGINGAALATLISYTLFNLVKFLYLWMREQLQPFTWRTSVVAALGLVSYLLVCQTPDLGHPLVNILVRSLALSGFYIIPILYWSLSPELSNLANQTWQRIRDRF